MRLKTKPFLSPCSHGSGSEEESFLGDETTTTWSSLTSGGNTCMQCAQSNLSCDFYDLNQPCKQCQANGHRCTPPGRPDSLLVNRIRTQATRIRRLLSAPATASPKPSTSESRAESPQARGSLSVSESIREAEIISERTSIEKREPWDLAWDEENGSDSEEADVYWIAPESWVVESIPEDLSNDSDEEPVLASEIRSGTTIPAYQCFHCSNQSLNCQFDQDLKNCQNCRASSSQCFVPGFHTLESKQDELLERIRKQEQQIQILTAQLKSLNPNTTDAVFLEDWSTLTSQDLPLLASPPEQVPPGSENLLYLERLYSLSFSSFIRIQINI